MAMSATLQSLLVSPAGIGRIRAGSNRVSIPPGFALPFRRSENLRVRCMAEDDRKEEVGPDVSTPPKSPAQPSPPSAPKKPKVSTKFSDVLAFSGPAPERINGRLAMVGFVAAMAVELSEGQDLFAQISDGGIPWFVGTSVLLSLASLIPLFKGVSVESEARGFMSPEAELWNGRLAMLGLVALAFTEYVKGGALV
ncbi:hypothetical protein NMG60_11025366 [Bertholletia excelsa]